MAQEEEVLGKAYDSRLMKRLLQYLRPYKWPVGISLVSILFKAVADVLGPYLVAIEIDRYLVPVPRRTPFDSLLSSNPYVGIAEIAAMYVGLIVFSFLLDYLQTYFMQWAGQMVMFDLRKQIFRHLQHMHIGFYDKNPVGRLVTRVTSDVDALNEMFTSGVVSIFEDVFVLAGITAIMLCMNWKLALITLAVLPLIAIATKIFRDKVRDSYRRIRTAIARINAHMQEHVSGMVVLQLFNREERAFDKFSDVNAVHMEAFKDAIMAHAVYYPVVEILSSIAIACVIWFGGRDVLHNLVVTSVVVSFSRKTLLAFHLARNTVVTLGVLIAFMQYAQRFFRPIQDLSEKYNILQAAMAASERVFKLLDSEPEIVSPAHSVAGDGLGRVEFRNVWFTYQRLDEAQQARLATATDEELNGYADIEWILRGVSFTIEPDETAAIVGHTGAGKTTITSLMMRFYDIQRGSILVDGVDVREQDLKKLRQRFGVVLQDPFLFTGTISDNVRLGSTWITDERLERACDEVNVGDFIRTLPLKFAEPVRERGATLSTGQKQLISFARALAHDPGILILDEATSSVDTETELRVRLALSRMITGRTSILIAHRLSTIQRADTILVMHKGQLREKGNHQELLTHRGLYWKLYQLQYRDQELGAEATVPLQPLSAD